MKAFIKSILKHLGIELKELYEWIGKWSIGMACSQNNYNTLISRLRDIQPDLSGQYSADSKDTYNNFIELKLRAMHAFQCKLMLMAMEGILSKRIKIVDIGDSAGTHMLYLKELASEGIDVDTTSVNLDPRAVEKVRARGLNAVLCRAEELDTGKKNIDFFTSFEMIEHLHNPAVFFYRLAKKSSCDKMVLTVPYLRQSRVGLHNVRHNHRRNVFAEDEHIFELNPRDWSLLIQHSGWRVVYSETYYQYPIGRFLISPFLSSFWRNTDFEGFWGAILEKDTSFCDFYQDWED